MYIASVFFNVKYGHIVHSSQVYNRGILNNILRYEFQKYNHNHKPIYIYLCIFKYESYNIPTCENNQL